LTTELSADKVQAGLIKMGYHIHNIQDGQMVWVTRVPPKPREIVNIPAGIDCIPISLLRVNLLNASIRWDDFLKVI